ncbi:hypothetical protein MA16_Dca009115 [Dendrobium catenatum]|uniref:Uncharacterized protein n=1 Tax=Dendrobium catenatum TaxID=906689 RepID=A0A2I0VRK5_9ASPA|nr:hypothetical protein MA16_Dca009115 [Dendrobium catenatum]
MLLKGSVEAIEGKNIQIAHFAPSTPMLLFDFLISQKASRVAFHLLSSSSLFGFVASLEGIDHTSRFLRPLRCRSTTLLRLPVTVCLRSFARGAEIARVASAAPSWLSDFIAS